MSTDSDLIDHLLLEIQESVSCASRILVHERSSNGFTIQVGSSADALITVTVHNRERPSFSATYPLLSTDRKGASAVVEHTSEDVLGTAVKWFTRKVFRHGFVPPEGYGKQHRNTGRAEQVVADQRPARHESEST